MQTATKDLLLPAATVDIQAGEAKQPPRVRITAYSGGLMKVGGWGLIAIDLSKLDLGGEQVAILSDHDATLDGILGQGVAEVREGKLVVSGSVSTTTAAAQKVIDLEKSGFQFQASVGIEPAASKPIARGEVQRVNGRELSAPDGFTLIQGGRLREVSIVSLGCDAQTSVSIAAQKGSDSMSVELDENAIRTQERERLKEIDLLCGDLREWRTPYAEQVIKARAQAIEGEISMELLRCRVLECLRASRPQVPAILTHHIPASDSKSLTAALFSHLGLESIGEKHLGAEAMERGRGLRGSHLLDFCRAACELEGVTVPAGRMELVRAGLSTIALPVALGEIANKVLFDAYAESPATWRAFAAIRQVSDFKNNTGVRPSMLGQLEQIAPGGELKHGTMNEALFPFKIDTFGKMLSIDRRDLINDSLGVFLDTSRAMGQTAQRKLSDLVYQILLANAGGYFSAANGNLLTGADSALSVEGLSKAITLMAAQRDAEGNDLDVRPTTLVVPAELAVAAQTILQSEQIQRNAGEGTVNVLKNIVALQVEPRLSNTQKFGTQASKKAWYLFAAPFAAPMIVAFLNGQESPTSEFFGLDSDPNRLAASWRIFHDFGAALGDPRAAVKSNGQ